MLFTLKEIVKWLGMTVFEIWLHLLSVFLFTILAVLKHEGAVNISWWYAFIPLFTCDGLNTYFCLIVFIRMFKEQEYRQAALRLLSSLMCVTLIFVFKILLCQKLAKQNELSYSEILAPIFILLQVLVIKACQVH
ncbi:transmembrane protein 203-like [Lineus longissimus]|uniref:transmembrane protein 203-like n=1 Tax=Lineus longissimus TaxID=88925 RepID=UPI00315C67AF